MDLPNFKNYFSANHLASHHSFIEIPHNVLSLVNDERGHLVLSCAKIETQLRLSNELGNSLRNGMYCYWILCDHFPMY